MQTVYATEEAPQAFSRSIFLAGPSPRSARDPNWRLEALACLERLGFDGVVFIPLPRDGQWSHGYLAQVDWETRFLHMADAIVFWVPRDLTVAEAVPAEASAERAMRLPAFTTNVEFGAWANSGKVFLGCPEEAHKVRYLQHHAAELGIPMAGTLEGILQVALGWLGAGAKRSGGAREVPLHIWRLPHFQDWYVSQVRAGHRLDGARVLWSFQAGPSDGFTFAYALQVRVRVAGEDRHKTNEFILGRPDISALVAYRRPDVEAGSAPDRLSLKTEIALVREFRSPARTSSGFVHELPGGSSWRTDEDPRQVMMHELEEETGLGASAGFALDPARIRRVGARQLAATFSVHQAHVYACELTREEMAFLKSQAAQQVVLGVEEDSERTRVEICTLADLLNADVDTVDWSMTGMILTALAQASRVSDR